MGRPDDRVGEFLAHFGVKGMRWGVRRDRGGSGKAPNSDDHERAVATRKKARSGGGTKALSNKELQDLITRANLESQFKRLHPSRSEAAVRFAADILLGVGKQQISRIANDYAGKQVGKMMG